MVVKKLGISLVLIIVLITVPLGFSELIQCNNPKHVLVERSENRLACVYESTAAKLGWKIIVPLDVSTTDMSYWLPIPEEDREDFAKKFVVATGGSIIGEVNEHGEYKTDRIGSISLGPYVVIYRVHESGVDATQTQKFVRDFMDSMEFEYEKENFHYRELPFYREGPSNERQFYTIKSEYSTIQFEFSHRYEGSFVITFTGWTNNPESIIFTLSEDVAIQKTNDFSKNLDFEDLYCDLQRIEVTFVNKIVIGGIPYYESSIGKCFGDEPELGDVIAVFVYVNSVNEYDIFLRVHNISDE